MIEVTWVELKNFIATSIPYYKVTNTRGDYEVWVSAGEVVKSILTETSDKSDFDTNYAAKAYNLLENTPLSTDIDKFLNVRIQHSITGASTWKNSYNLCDAIAAETPWELVTASTKKLHVLRTRLYVTSDVDLNSNPAVFSVYQGATLLSQRTYANEWDYRLGCDEIEEYSWGTKYTWNYDSSVVLKNSTSMSIKLDMSNGPFAGTKAFLSIKLLSLPESV